MRKKLGELSKPRAGKVLGIDCSTKTLAFSVFDDKKPLHCGEVFFRGNNLYERLAWIHDRVPALVDIGLLQADYVAFEGAILVGDNARVGISLAYVYGAVMGALMQSGLHVENVNPLTWQSAIGNPNLNKSEKEAIKKEFPGKSASWYKNKGREIRKQRTLDFSKKFFDIDSGSDNVGDAVAIGWYAANNLVVAV